MKIGKKYYLTVIGVALIGCAAPMPPELVKAPEPPVEWNITLERKSGCPYTNGMYDLTPMVAIFQKNASWEISIGNSYDYILLLPFDRVAVLERVPNEALSALSGDELLFESSPQGDVLRITSSVKTSKSFETHILKKTDGDYKCEAGNLVFPEFKIQGGSEGSTLSGRIYRQATKTLRGDLLFYEQIRGYKTVHKYYLFKLMDS